MRVHRPAVPWERGRQVAVFVADQTYQWIGMQKRGRRSMVEQHDAFGMSVFIKHEVYINSVHVHLPASIGTLSPGNVATIVANNGSPYTEDYNNVLVPLQRDAVEASLRDFAADALAPVAALAARLGLPVELLSLRQIADAMYGRPRVDPGGASEFDILEPLLNTDTKSYDDFIKITAHLEKYVSVDTIVRIFYGDGQSVIRFKDLKRAFTSRYASWLIGVGGFHEHAHAMFAYTEMFNDCFVRACLDFLEIECQCVYKVRRADRRRPRASPSPAQSRPA